MSLYTSASNPVYDSATKLGNIQENWIVQLGFYNGDADGSGEGGWDATLQADGSANLLTAGVNTSTTTIPVDDGTVFAANDYIKIESEIVKVVSISSNDLTVVRTQMGTSAEAHEDDDVIYWNNFTPIALSDTTVDDVFYHGAITSSPKIRTSINLSKSTAKTGNISLSIANFNYKGDDFSAELFLGTRKYINRTVRIYSQLSGDSTLANCLQVYSGRLIDISHDTNSIKLSITEQRPWDFISVPQDISAKGNYFPVVYGDFTENASTYGSPAYIGAFSKALHPVQVDSHGFHYHCLNHEDTGSTDKILHYYESGADAFIPVELSYDAESYSGGFALKTDWHLKRHFKFKPGFAVKRTFGSDVGNVFDGNADQTISDNYATLSMNAVSAGTSTYIHKDNNYSIPSFDDPPDTISSSDNHGLTIEMRWRMTGFYGATSNSSGLNVNKVEVFNQSRYATGTLIDTMDDGTIFETAGSFNNTDADSVGDAVTITEVTSISNGAATATEFGAYPYNNGLSIRVKRTVTSSTDGSGGSSSPVSGTLDVADVRLIGTFRIHHWNTTGAGSQRVSSVKQLYSGHDGFAKSFTGGSGTASTGLEAHRDLLFRFAGWDDTDTNIYNYDDDLDIEAARITSAWNIRWWENKSVDLKKILDRMQKEFCFIFKFRHDGSGSYWFIKDSYASGDVAQTLKKDDITSLQINNTPFSELLTKMEVNYEKHPAENRYISNLTSADTTNNQRTTWNILAKENIKKINLNMNVNKPGNANPGGGNPNDGFADYYMNIFGDVKKLINCQIINSAKGYSLETGDIIKFSDTAGEMPVDPFGDNWADYYMITDLQRSPGSVSITAREVG